MNFEIIMNMPSKNSPVHRIVIRHPIKSLEAMTEYLMNHDFVIAEEFYQNRITGVWENHGPIAINHRYIGKIKELKE